MANTLLDVKALVADDLARGDLTTQIATEIQNAIYRWQTERFYFNELRTITFNTVAAQEFYTSVDNAYIPNLLDIDSIITTASGSTYTLTPRSYAWMEDIFSTSSITGQPTDYAYYGQQIRMYPTPDAVYPCRISSLVRLADLSGDTDSNAWTKAADAQDLIRFEAEYRIYMAVIRDEVKAGLSMNMRDQALARLRGETERRLGTGKAEPSQW